MTLQITQTYTAISLGNTAAFAGSGGTEPYSYQVLPNGAGGSIDSSGLYTAPSTQNSSPYSLVDTIEVTDAVSSIAIAKILVAPPLLLFCDILQNYLGLDSNHIFLFDQKIFEPTDSGLYIIIGVESCKMIGNVAEQDTSGSGLHVNQWVSMYNLLGINIISRSTAALYQKESVVAALNSNYAQQQQEKNNFSIGRISTGFTNLSQVDGAAIPYRFHINLGFQYSVSMASQSVGYYSTFNEPTVDINP